MTSTTVRLAHRVRLRHTGTGEVIEPVTARGVLPYGWAMRVRGGDVIVTARDGVPATGSAPVVTVTVARPQLLAAGTVDVTLDAADITVDVDPAPMIVELVLVTAGTGVPRTQRTVTARGTDGQTVPLAETDRGVYRSDPVVWTAARTPFDLLVDGDLLRPAAVDHGRSITRIRLVDTT